MKATVIKEVHATYSPRPGIESHRPSSGDGLAARLSGGRLDGHGMAGHHGRRGAQRLRRRAMRSPGRRARAMQHSWCRIFQPSGFMRLFG